MSVNSKENYSGNILLVDDSDVNRMIGSKLLQNLGLKITTANNGQRAIDLCKTHTFQLIFMDLEMPEVGGLAATTIIRENRLSYAPIYALTGTDNEYSRLLCRSVKMNGFILKPLNKGKLIKILDKVL